MSQLQTFGKVAHTSATEGMYLFDDDTCIRVYQLNKGHFNVKRNMKEANDSPPHEELTTAHIK